MTIHDDRHSRLLQRGLDILEFLAARPYPIGIRDLAQQIELSPSTCHRLLQILQERGYVCQDTVIQPPLSTDDSRIFLERVMMR
jgi:DNA-binding MarR family transcriptional regulator